MKKNIWNYKMIYTMDAVTKKILWLERNVFTQQPKNFKSQNKKLKVHHDNFEPHPINHEMASYQLMKFPLKI